MAPGCDETEICLGDFVTILYIIYKAMHDVEKSDFKTELKRKEKERKGRVKILQVEGKGLSHL